MEELLGMTDTAFLGRVGEVELGASAIAGVYFNILYMLGFGFSIGVQIIIGRRNGEAFEKGTGFSAIGRVFWQGAWFLAALAVLTMVLSYLLSPPLLRGLLRSENIFQASVVYVNWRIPGLLFAFMTALFRAFYVGIKETESLTWNSLVLVVSNIFLDWVLIFGHLGAPAMGIKGAALASTVAEGISFLFFVVWVAFKADPKYGLQKLVGPVWKELKHIFAIASWVMVEYVLNVSVWLLFFLFIEHLGEEPLAVANIVRSISEVPFVFSAAFASTAATLVSNIIGEGHPEGVTRVIRRVLMLCVVTMLPLLAFFALCPHLIIGLFTDIPSLVDASVHTLWVMCACTALTLPWNVYLQSVAGTGDTRVCLRIDVVALVIYAVFCTVIIGILKSSIAVCWTADAVYALCIWVQCTIYLRKPKDRTIPFDRIENARELGGLVMQDGRTIRPGRLVRTGHLNMASDKDVAILKERFRLTDIFDFRFDAERAGAPDREMEGVHNTQLSTLPQALIDGFTAGRADTTQIQMSGFMERLTEYAFNPMAQDLSRQLYPAIVTDPTSQQRYGTFLRGVLDAEGGALWHCSQGKDRCGWGAAFVLAALGASRETIVEDFDLSNVYYAPYVEALSRQVIEMGGGKEELAFIRAMVGVSTENFERTLDLIDAQYGSLSAYLEKALGFTARDQEKLRDKLLK